MAFDSTPYGIVLSLCEFTAKIYQRCYTLFLWKIQMSRLSFDFITMIAIIAAL